MTQVSELSVKIGLEGAEAAEAVLGRIADAAERAKAAIDALNGAGHGGIKIQIVGDLAQVEIAPQQAGSMVEAFVSGISQGGELTSALEHEYGLKRVGR